MGGATDRLDYLGIVGSADGVRRRKHHGRLEGWRVCDGGHRRLALAPAQAGTSRYDVGMGTRHTHIAQTAADAPADTIHSTIHQRPRRGPRLRAEHQSMVGVGGFSKYGSSLRARLEATNSSRRCSGPIMDRTVDRAGSWLTPSRAAASACSEPCSNRQGTKTILYCTCDGMPCGCSWPVRDAWPILSTLETQATQRNAVRLIMTGLPCLYAVLLRAWP